MHIHIHTYNLVIRKQKLMDFRVFWAKLFSQLNENLDAISLSLINYRLRVLLL